MREKAGGSGGRAAAFRPSVHRRRAGRGGAGGVSLHRFRGTRVAFSPAHATVTGLPTSSSAVCPPGCRESRSQPESTLGGLRLGRRRRSCFQTIRGNSVECGFPAASSWRGTAGSAPGPPTGPREQGRGPQEIPPRAHHGFPSACGCGCACPRVAQGPGRTATRPTVGPVVGTGRRVPVRDGQSSPVSNRYPTRPSADSGLSCQPAGVRETAYEASRATPRPGLDQLVEGGASNMMS